MIKGKLRKAIKAIDNVMILTILFLKVLYRYTKMFINRENLIKVLALIGLLLLTHLFAIYTDDSIYATTKSVGMVKLYHCAIGLLVGLLFKFK